MDPYSLPWIITDDALADLDQHLAAHAPERGAALLGPPGTRLITDIIVDPVDGGRAEYRHSDQLRIALEARRAVDANVTYMGTCHSHPSGMAAPSEPDRRAFRSTLDANPHLRDLLFPIVVDRRVEDLAPVYRGNHLTALSHGTLAGFTAVGHGRRTVIAPVELTVVPVGAQARAIARALDWRVAAIHPAEGPGGLPWLQVTWTSSDGGPAAQMLLPPAYPMAAPLLRPANAPVFLAPAWDPAGDPVAQALATLTTNAPTPPAGPAAPSPALAAPTVFLDRLTHHLPHRGDWHVTVAGAGSVGSVVAEALARSGVPRLTLVDPDPVEAANLSR